MDIPDPLLERARVFARERGLTLRELIANGLRLELEAAETGDADQLELRTFSSEVREGVDLSNWRAVRDLLAEAGRG